MSVQSMTGFGKGEAEGEDYSLSVEIKTVNNRFKDIRFKMGSVFNSVEINLKKKLESHFARGSFDVYINYKKNAAKKTEIDLDYAKIKKFMDQFESHGIKLTASPTEFLRGDFYKEDEDKEVELLGLLDSAFETAVTSLKESREEEGKKLVQTLQDHQASYASFYQKIIDMKEEYQVSVKERLLKKFEKEGGEFKVDEPRFLQEVIYYLEKLDVDEEINRIKIHLEKLTSVFSGQSEVGRQIDFLMQELNRETNTIGSKSGSQEISEQVVQMKVQLEKIREQALNLQ